MGLQKLDAESVSGFFADDPGEGAQVDWLLDDQSSDDPLDQVLTDDSQSHRCPV